MADPLFRALARPQLVAGVSYAFFVLNGILAAELFLIFKSLFALLPWFVVHALGVAAHLRDPNIISVWITRLSRTPKVANHRLWGANVYQP